MLSDFNYSKVYSELIQTVNLPEGYSFALRFFAGYGNGQIPAQAKFFTATSSPIEQFYKPIYRSKIFPMDLRSHIEPFGGAGLRGYFDQNLSGDRTYSLNFELNLPSLLPFINRMPIVGNLFRTTFFFDAGKVWGQNQRTSLKDLRYDFGIGIRSDIIESVSNFTDIFTEIGLSSIRVDFPIYVSHPASDGKKFNFRWVIGFERTF
jgi:outer membrane protein assembly factor BamA